MSLTRILVMLGIALAGALGCNSCCDEGVAPIGGPPACLVDTECKPGFAFRFGECIPGGCLEDSECCPGTRCRADLNTCFPILLDSEYECEQSADCADPAQRCVATAIGEREPLPVCVFTLCAGDSDCGFGRACFEGRCVIGAPCGGSCPEGTACDVITGKCAAFPAGSAGCDKDCGGGLKVFSDPASMSGEVCCGLACECAGLPPIVATRFGEYSRVVFAGGEVQVSAYDAQFGDLVLAHFTPGGTFSRLDYLDGIPGGAQPTGDTAGARGGISEPGPNVGTHTSIAADGAGKVRIAYHDVDGRSLKVAVQQTDGSFSNHFVDGGAAGSDVGRFSDIFVGADGTIFISYFAHNATLAGFTGRSTGVKLAKSRNATPSSATDWDISVVDARPVFDPCNGTCAAGAACVAGGGGAVCLPEAGGCSPTCSSSQTCVDNGGTIECAGPFLPPENVDVPRGRGLYTSVALDAGNVIVAYYDAIDGDLRAAVVPTSGAPAISVVDGDGQGGRRAGDIGRFPTVATIGANLAIVYEDFARHEVRAWQGTRAELGSAGTYTLVDRGADVGRSGKLFVGAGARLARGQAAPLVVYQDASKLDLKMATFAGGAWTPSVLVDGGAHGFYSDVAISGGTAFIVSVEAKLDERGVEASRLGLTTQPVP